MSKETRQNIGVILVIVAWTAMFTWLGSSFGYLRGYEKAFEDNKRIECEVKFSYTPYSEIDGRCIKYFEKGAK